MVREGKVFLPVQKLDENLHWMSTVVTFEVSFPRLLFATHWYWPLSVLLTFDMINSLLGIEKLILELLLKEDPPLVHNIMGAGFPVELQNKVKLLPSSFVTFA